MMQLEVLAYGINYKYSAPAPMITTATTSRRTRLQRSARRPEPREEIDAHYGVGLATFTWACASRPAPADRRRRVPSSNHQNAPEFGRRDWPLRSKESHQGES